MGAPSSGFGFPMIFSPIKVPPPPTAAPRPAPVATDFTTDLTPAPRRKAGTNPRTAPDTAALMPAFAASGISRRRDFSKKCTGPNLSSALATPRAANVFALLSIASFRRETTAAAPAPIPPPITAPRSCGLAGLRPVNRRAVCSQLLQGVHALPRNPSQAARTAAGSAPPLTPLST